MSHSVDQTFFIKGFLIQQCFQILTDLLFISPVCQCCLHILKHLCHFYIRTAMLRSFQGSHRCCNRRIRIGTGRSNYMSRKGGVITTAMIHMKHKCHIQDLCLKRCILSVFTKHHQDILRCGKLRMRCINIKILTSSVIICMVGIYHKHWELTDQIQTLTKYVRNRNIIRFVIVCIHTQDIAGNVVHHITARRFHDYIPYKVRRKCPALCDHGTKFIQLHLCRKFSKQKEICCLFKSRVLCF